MLWINFLHLYQPANASPLVVREAADKSYAKIIRVLEEHSEVKFTLNISGCLLLSLEELGYGELIGRIRDLYLAGRIELVGTAAYHPLLPLMPESEIRAQILENERILARFFGEIKPRGFFFPEMAYSPAAAKIVASLGYEWLILDEIAADGRLGEKDEQVRLDTNSGLKVLLRSRSFSCGYLPDFLNQVPPFDPGAEKMTVITATDGELYGLRHIDHGGEFEKLLKRPDLKTMTVSMFLDSHPGKVPDIAPRSHSWESTEEEYAAGRPFHVWQDQDNAIQVEIWNFFDYIHGLLERFTEDPNYVWARWHFMRGSASCTWWWASARDFKHIFGPVSWNPDQIELGLDDLVKAARSLDDPATRDDKLRSEALWLKIKKMIWEKHWKEFWKK